MSASYVEDSGVLGRDAVSLGYAASRYNRVCVWARILNLLPCP